MRLVSLVAWKRFMWTISWLISFKLPRLGTRWALGAACTRMSSPRTPATSTAVSMANVFLRDLAAGTSASAGLASRDSCVMPKKKERDIGHGDVVSRGRSQREGRIVAKKSIEIITSSQMGAAPSSRTRCPTVLAGTFAGPSRWRNEASAMCAVMEENIKRM